MKIIGAKIIVGVVAACATLLTLTKLWAHLHSECTRMNAFSLLSTTSDEGAVLSLTSLLACTIAVILLVPLILGLLGGLYALSLQASGHDPSRAVKFALRFAPAVGRHIAVICARHAKALALGTAIAATGATVMSPIAATAATTGEHMTGTTITQVMIAPQRISDSFGLHPAGDPTPPGDYGDRTLPVLPATDSHANGATSPLDEIPEVTRTPTVDLGWGGQSPGSKPPPQKPVPATSAAPRVTTSPKQTRADTSHNTNTNSFSETHSGDKPGGILVKPGDTLWSIAATALGETASPQLIARSWPDWFEANRDQIGDNPDFIRPGLLLNRPAP